MNEEQEELTSTVLNAIIELCPFVGKIVLSTYGNNYTQFVRYKWERRILDLVVTFDGQIDLYFFPLNSEILVPSYSVDLSDPNAINKAVTMAKQYYDESKMQIL